MSRVLSQPQTYLRSLFYRGGTSRGLLFHENALAPYRQSDRDRMICRAMGSPDPDGRQIDGIGGGTSSTSKVAIVSRSNSNLAMHARNEGIPLPGLEWIDDANRIQKISDVVYRAGQVSIREQSIDWGSTCGNMMAAVAHYSINSLGLPRPRAFDIDSGEDAIHSWPVRILAHDTGKVFTAHVPVDVKRFKNSNAKDGTGYWRLLRPSQQEDTQIAGVPGMGSGIVIESPLEGSILPTGNEIDTIEIDGKIVEISIIDTGLPVVFVSATSLDIPLTSLLEHPASIDSNTNLMAKLEQVRQRACSLSPALKLSAPSPKLCVVHPRCEYITTGGNKMPEDSMDILIRTVSTGQLHRTVPATTLAALAASTCFTKSIVVRNITSSSPCKATQAVLQSDIRGITVGQPAGCSIAMVKVADALPTSILMKRTARLIMRGEVPADPTLEVNESIIALRSRHSSDKISKVL